jgi:hypothetical protein
MFEVWTKEDLWLYLQCWKFSWFQFKNSQSLASTWCAKNKIVGDLVSCATQHMKIFIFFKVHTQATKITTCFFQVEEIACSLKMC